ncbi:catalase family protein [Amantichitinum ursilacus]|uniref:Catalase n=1 Tax=Amantichitinum ursilacus TaxID=857265 RepID=A0A0N0GKJ9_9NEIS|nr:catalase family protein [Amantichitinum ursilacus]KPC49075.1 Catalase [Amantichitinum ursilacus]
MMTTRYVLFDASVEQIDPDEEQTFQAIAASMHHISAIMFERYQHAVRSVHAKTHGVVKGEMIVRNDLPRHLAQGVFATPGVYSVLGRYSTTPGDILADSISTPRGFAIKILGVSGAKLDGHEGALTQDFVMVNGLAFSVATAADFLKQMQLLEKHANDPETLKQAISTTARGTNALLHAIGQDSSTLASLGHPETHILGESFSTMAAIRYGEYVAKLRLTPATPEMQALHGQALNMHDHPSALREAVAAFCNDHELVYDVQIQLCSDLAVMPVEDASVVWPEDQSPWHSVAELRFARQNSFNPARVAWTQDVISFSPWHGLQAHRPLGQIMRARKRAYQMSAQYRREMNGRAPTEPRSIDEIPDH